MKKTWYLIIDRLNGRGLVHHYVISHFAKFQPSVCNSVSAQKLSNNLTAGISKWEPSLRSTWAPGDGVASGSAAVGPQRRRHRRRQLDAAALPLRRSLGRPGRPTDGAHLPRLVRGSSPFVVFSF